MIAFVTPVYGWDEDDLKEFLKTPDIGAHIYFCRPVRTGVSHF